jgi:hypothetical protein
MSFAPIATTRVIRCCSEALKRINQRSKDEAEEMVVSRMTYEPWWSILLGCNYKKKRSRERAISELIDGNNWGASAYYEMLKTGTYYKKEMARIEAIKTLAETCQSRTINISSHDASLIISKSE